MTFCFYSSSLNLVEHSQSPLNVDAEEMKTGGLHRPGIVAAIIFTLAGDIFPSPTLLIPVT